MLQKLLTINCNRNSRLHHCKKRSTNVSVAESTTNIIATEVSTCIIAMESVSCIVPTETANCRIDYRNFHLQKWCPSEIFLVIIKKLSERVRTKFKGKYFSIACITQWRNSTVHCVNELYCIFIIKNKETGKETDKETNIYSTLDLNGV